MMLDVRPEDLEALEAIFRRFAVPASDLGSVAAGPYEEVLWNEAPAGHLDVGFRVDRPPLRRRVRPRVRRHRPPPAVPDDRLDELLTALMLAPDSASREPVLRVYDHEVQGRTVVKPLTGRITSPSHGDAAVLQPRPTSAKGLAVTTAAQPWACHENPRVGSELVVEEAARNLYAVGARPDAFSNCLNFGNPEDPRVLGDFRDATLGLATAARALGFAVPSGNVSLYNGGLGREIPPTPVLLATGLVDDVAHAVTSDLKADRDPIYLLGTSRPELGGSLFARRNGLSGLRPPPADPAALRRLGEALLGAMAEGLVRAAHDISDGGLAVAITEMGFGGGLGFDVDLEATGLSGPGLALVAEGASRFLVEVPVGATDRFEAALEGQAFDLLGRVTAADGLLRWAGKERARIDLGALYPRWRTGLGLP
jgi:phosphoribosylformylglycinamidine synthase